MLNKLSFACFLVAMLGGVGCASGPRHVPPTLPAAEVATLKCDGATLVSIDGSEVGGMSMSVLGTPLGNQTTVLPGRHEVVVATGSRSLKTRVDLAAGSTYRFKGKDFGSRIVLVNETAGREWSISPRTLTVFDAQQKPHPLEEFFAP